MVIALFFLLLMAVVWGSLLYFGAIYLFLSLRSVCKGESVSEVGEKTVANAFFEYKIVSAGGHFIHRLTSVAGSIRRIHLVGYITTILIIFILASTRTTFYIGIGINKEIDILELIQGLVFPCGFVLWLILLGVSACIVKD